MEKEDGCPRAFATVLIREGRSTRAVLADTDGRFVAVLDPAWKGKVELVCEEPGPLGKPKLRALVELRADQREAVLRLQRIAK